MGLNRPISSSSTGSVEPVLKGNPNPQRFEILRVARQGIFLAVEVRYPDCSNYEGRKILLFKGLTEEKLRRLESLDPHFTGDPKVTSPIARFEPTSSGWDMAIKLASVGEHGS